MGMDRSHRVDSLGYSDCFQEGRYQDRFGEGYQCKERLYECDLPDSEGC